MKITSKMMRDVESMMYFVNDKFKDSITDEDIEATAIYSMTGKKPEIETEGFMNLRWGKTYRDEAITGWKEMLSDGLITKAELISDMPDNLKMWLYNKLKHVVYNAPTDFLMSDINAMTEDERSDFSNSYGQMLVETVKLKEDNPERDLGEMLLGLNGKSTSNTA